MSRNPVCLFSDHGNDAIAVGTGAAGGVAAKGGRKGRGEKKNLE